MNASSIITRIRAVGGEIVLADDGIKLRTPLSLREEITAQVRVGKNAIKCALKAEAGIPWGAEDYRAFFDERAGVAEYEWELTRAAAEAEAFDLSIIEWLNRNPQPASATFCRQCRLGPTENDPLLPFGTGHYGHSWLHLHCWPGWFASLQKEAVLALGAMGIAPPTTVHSKSDISE